jgi:hypothetical protein
MATTRIESAPLRSERPGVIAPAALLFGAPAAALAAGVAAEWLDFRALRYPLLLTVGLGVLATALALFVRQRSLRAFALTVLLGVTTWACAEAIYVIIHTTRGEAFDADHFGPQWSQALALIAVHALFLGIPTGIAAGTARHVIAKLRA